MFNDNFEKLWKTIRNQRLQSCKISWAFCEQIKICKHIVQFSCKILRFCAINRKWNLQILSKCRAKPFSVFFFVQTHIYFVEIVKWQELVSIVSSAYRRWYSIASLLFPVAVWMCSSLFSIQVVDASGNKWMCVFPSIFFKKKYCLCWMFPALYEQMMMQFGFYSFVYNVNNIIFVLIIIVILWNWWI